MRVIAAVLALGIGGAVLASCTDTPPVAPLEQTSTNNPTAHVELLFSIHDCEVYRFEDDGHYHYVTLCKGGMTSTDYDYRVGKSTRHFNEEIGTE